MGLRGTTYEEALDAVLGAGSYTYLTCPACGERIREPFVLGVTAPYTHRSSRVREIGSCRLLVVTGRSADGPHRLVKLGRLAPDN